MAKRRAASAMRQAAAKPVVPAALLALLLAPHAHAAWKFVPNASLRQTYTDNVALSREEDAEGRFVTEISPGFTLENNGPRLKLRANYQLSYFAFDDNDVEGTRHASSQLGASARGVLLDDLLFFDADARVGQQAVSAFGQQVNHNGYATANRANIKTWRVSPYLQHRFGSTASAQLRYTRDAMDAGRSGLGDSDSDNLSLNIASGPLFRRIGWGLQYNHQRLSDSVVEDSNVRTISANLSYRLLNSLSLNANGGYDEYDYQSLGGATTKGKFWQGGFTWTPGARTSLSASAGKRYYGNSYSLQLLHRSRRSVWNLNYSDSVSTTRSQFLIPSTIDTAATLDRLFTAQIPDPAERARVVEAYIRFNNLPTALANNINYLSNRYFLSRQLRGSAAFSAARTTLVLSAFNVRREGLSTVAVDSALSGSFDARINDNMSEKGASALFNMRLTGRTTLNASLSKSRSLSKSLNIESDNTALRLALTRQFSPRTQGALELRSVKGVTADRVADYRENALTASLTMKF